jgi:lysozyme
VRAYRCQAGVLTIGYGHTGPDVSSGQRITEREADALLEQDIGKTLACIQRCVKVPLTQNQVDALASWVYNLGCGSLSRSSLLRHLNARDYAGAAAQFSRWTHADGKELPGLVARRKEEREMFLEGVAGLRTA